MFINTQKAPARCAITGQPRRTVGHLNPSVLVARSPLSGMLDDLAGRPRRPPLSTFSVLHPESAADGVSGVGNGPSPTLRGPASASKGPSLHDIASGRV